METKYHVVKILALFTFLTEQSEEPLFTVTDKTGSDVITHQRTI